MEQKGITVAGSLIADMIYSIESYPKIGRLTQITDQVKHVGGTCNLILDLAKLDSELPVKVSGIVGQDSYGDFIKEMLEGHSNIALDNVTTEGDSSVTIIMESSDVNQRTFFYLPVASDKYNESYIDWNMINADIFHLEYLLLMAEMDAADEEFGTRGARTLYMARQRGMKTSIDVVSEESGRYRKVVWPALKYTDYCTINEMEAEGITGITLQTPDESLIEENVWKAAEMIRDLGVSVWVVIHTPKCGYGLDCKTGKKVKVKSVKLPKGYIKGTTGAGDAYCCGILYGAYCEKTLAEALHLANACAICSLSDVSGTQGMRSYEEVMINYRKYIGESALKESITG